MQEEEVFEAEVEAMRSQARANMEKFSAELKEKIQQSDKEDEKKDMGGVVGMQAEVLLGTAAPGYRDRALKWPFEC